MLCGNPDTPSPQIGRYTSGRQLAFEKYRRAGRIGRTSKTLRLVVLSCSKDKQTLRGAAILPSGIKLAPVLVLLPCQSVSERKTERHSPAVQPRCSKA